MQTKRFVSLMLAVLLSVTSIILPEPVFGSVLDDDIASYAIDNDAKAIGGDITEISQTDEPAGVGTLSEAEEPVPDSLGDIKDLSSDDNSGSFSVNNDQDDEWLTVDLGVDGWITPYFSMDNAPRTAKFTYQLFIGEGQDMRGLYWFNRDNIENLKPIRIRQSILNESGVLGCYIKVENAGEKFNGKFYSNTINYTVPSNKISSPSNLRVTKVDGTEWLEWDAVEGNGGYLVRLLAEGNEPDQDILEDVDDNRYNLSKFADDYRNYYGYRKFKIWVSASSGNINKARCSDYSTGVDWELKSAVSVTLDKNELSLKKGSSAVITPSFVNDLTDDDRVLIWSSSDASVAAVDQAGNVTGVGVGTAVITAKTATGVEATNSCEVTVYEPIQSITLDPSSKTIGTGDEFTLKADVGAYTATECAVTATGGAVVYGPAISFNPSDNNLTVTNLGDGKALVKAASTIPGSKVVSQVIVKSTDGGNKSAVCTVTIGLKADSVNITAPSEQKTLYKGKKLALTAKVTPENALNTGINWTSSDNSIATVDQKGNVTAVSAGDVTISATDLFSNKTGTYSLKVITPLNKLSLSATSVTLHTGKKYALKPVPVPADASIGAPGYEIVGDNGGCIDIGPDGVITAKELPTGKNKVAVKVKVTAKDATGTEKSATCTVNVVSSEVKATKVSLSDTKISMGVGTARTISARVIPEWADNTRIVWSEDGGNKVISITENADGSITIRALSTGKVKITAKAADDSNKKAECTVNVGNPVSSVQIKNKAKINQYLAVGKKTKLNTVVSAASGKPANTSVKWTSSDESVATVDQKGNVTARSVGNVTITATGEAPESGTAQSDSITFYVCVPVKSISVAVKSILTAEGDSGELQPVVVAPGNATYKNIKWESNNPQVVAVSKDITADGEQLKFLAVGPGNAKLTGKTMDGTNKKIVISVKVLGRMHDIDVKLKVKNPQRLTIDNDNSKSVSVSGLNAAKKQTVTLAPVLTSTASNKNVTFTSSNSTVATVDKKGTVKAVGLGTAVITMTTADGNYTATCTITTIHQK